MLTDAQCRAAAPRKKAYKLGDAHGLYLYVTATGHRSWRLKYRFAGREKRLVLGAYPEITLKDARGLRDKAREMLRHRLDPSAERKRRVAEAAAAEVNSFERIARTWHEAQKGRWSQVHARNVLDSLEKDVFAAIGKDPVSTISAPAILELLRAIEQRGAIETAHRVRQRISDIFVYAIASDMAAVNPAAMIAKALRPVRRGRQPAFRTIDDARALLEAAEATVGQPVTKLASRLLALTAVRPGVLRSVPWSEFEGLDTDRPLWRIPAQRMKLELDRKNQEAFEFVVPLSRQAVEALTAVRTLTGRGPLPFPNLRWPHRPMSENAIGYLYNRLIGFRGRHVPHGWRSTFSTVMNERAVELDRPADRAIIDLMLAHIPAGVEGAYNRAAYMPRRRALAQEWADLLLEGFAPASSLLAGPRH